MPLETGVRVFFGTNKTGAKAPLTLGGTVEVICRHGQSKRSIKKIEFDIKEHSPHVCSCCENMFLKPVTQLENLMWCDECSPLNN